MNHRREMDSLRLSKQAVSAVRRRSKAQNRCKSKGRQVAPRVMDDYLPNDYEGQFSANWGEANEKRCCQNPMTIKCLVEFALRVVARKLTKLCRRYAAGGIVLIQGELIGGAPCENRKSKH
jgi:hypothetical protein